MPSFITGKGIGNLLLGSAVMLSVAAGAGFVVAQDAVPVSPDQGGEGGSVGVDGTTFVVDLYGGGDDNGSIYGGAGSLVLPMGTNTGLQADAIGGIAGDSTGYAGGALQLFYRDPLSYSIGLAGGGFVIDSASQYAIAGIAEYYMGNVTLEGLAGYQGGDINDGWYGRAGIAIYATPNFRIGAGVRYDEASEFGGDVQVEALLSDSPGVSLFAAGVYDEDGAMGIGGVRFYFNAGGSLAETDRTKQAGGTSLIDLHRHGARQNFLLQDPGFALRQISQAAGALDGDEGFGKLTAAEPAAPAPASPLAIAGGGTPGDGLIDTVSNLVGDLGNQTALEPVTGLVQSLLDDQGGVLAPLTAPLNEATAVASGPLGPLTGALSGVTDTLGGALQPVVAILGDGLATVPLGPLGNAFAAGGPLTGLPVVGDLLGAITGSFLAGNSPEKLETTTSLLGGLLGGSIRNATGGSGILADVPVLGDGLRELAGPAGALGQIPSIGGLLRGLVGGLAQ